MLYSRTELPPDASIVIVPDVSPHAGSTTVTVLIVTPLALESTIVESTVHPEAS